METDFTLMDEGTIAVLTPVSDEAKDWAEEYLPAEAMHWGAGTVIESRYVGPILEGIADAGLSVGGI